MNEYRQILAAAVWTGQVLHKNIESIGEQNLGAPLEGDITTTILLRKKKKYNSDKSASMQKQQEMASYTHLFNYELPVNIFCPWVSQKELIRNEVIRNRHENFLFQSKILPCFNNRNKHLMNNNQMMEF